MKEMIITDSNFETEVLKSDTPVLVDFWAPWCGPCRVQGPIIDELAKDMEGKGVKVGKLDVDENPKTAQAYSVMSIPTIMIFKGGEPIEKMTGVQDKHVLQEMLEKLV